MTTEANDMDEAIALLVAAGKAEFAKHDCYPRDPCGCDLCNAVRALTAAEKATEVSDGK